MAPRVVQPIVSAARRLRRRGAGASATADMYGGSYFGEGRDPLDRMGLSGYERYDRESSNANAAAYLAWKWFDVARTLDAGCALGFVVEALREVGIDARGVDISEHAVTHAAPGALGHVQQGSLTERLPFTDQEFELVTVLEVLEHVPPDDIPAALRELHRIAGGYVFATIPSFGPNAFGRDGWYDGKVRPERLAEYHAMEPSFDGPIAFDDLAVDARGEPIEGHLSIASYTWWQRAFENAGFIRCGSTERHMHVDLARFALTEFWSLYVFRVPEVAEPTAPARPSAECAALEQRWQLDDRRGNPDDVAAALAHLTP